MTQRIKTLLRSSFGFLLAAVFLIVAFRGVDFPDLWDSLQAVDYFWIALLIPVGLLSHYVRAWRWKYLLGHVKKDISTRNLFSAVMIGYMVNNVLPRVGELIRPYVAGKLEGFSKSTALGTVVIERIIDMMSFFVILSLVLFFVPGSLGVFMEDIQAVRPLFLLGSVAGLAIFTLLFFKSESLVRSIRIVLKLVPGRHRTKVEGVFESFVSGFRVGAMRREFLRIGLLSVIMWGLYALALYVPFQAFEPIAAAHLDFSAAVILLTLSTIAFVIPVPGAFGTYHSFLKFALVSMYGIDEVTALSFSIVTHELGAILVVITGIYFFLKDHFKVSEVSLETSTEKPVQS
ncbi:MAG: flippase-like domain-containing protein [Ignavibacteriales bacterium]|nr:flippase-like domain-containing protein [Ignavibacteriales bacterium]